VIIVKNYCKDIAIYRALPFNHGGIDFICSQQTNCQDIPVYCGNFTNYCVSKLQPSHSNVTCVNELGLCGFTFSPTNAPTRPTHLPTKRPTTHTPTAQPTFKTETGNPTAHHQNITHVPQSSKKHASSSVGVIVGAVIGGVVGFIILSVIIFILFRRCRIALPDQQATSIAMQNKSFGPKHNDKTYEGLE